MNNLPLEIHFKILDNLDLEDLFNYRLSSKRLKNAAEKYPIKELIFDCERKKFNWFYTNHLNDFRYYINESKLLFLKNSSFNFKALKSLFIKCEELNFLSKFDQLENLAIYLKKLKGSNELKLTNLKSLSISKNDESKITNSSVIINTPNLIALNILKSNETKFLLNYPLKFEILHLFTYDEKLVYQCKNLKIIKIEEDFDCHYDFLEKLSSLKFINVNTYKNVRKLFYQKNQLNRSDLIISHKAVTIIKPDLDSNDDEFNYNVNYNFLDNLDLVNDKVPTNYLSYNHAKDQLPEIETKFSNDKFDSINTISVHENVEDEDHLIFIIKNCRNLEKLDFRYAGLTNQFYVKLNSLSLFSIRIFEDNLQLDFQFISKMLYLNYLTSNYIEIKRLENNKYSIKTLKKLSIPDKKFKFNELADWINRINLMKNIHDY